MLSCSWPLGVNVLLSSLSSELMAEVKAAEKRREDTMEARVSQVEQDREQIMRDLERSPPKASEGKR